MSDKESTGELVEMVGVHVVNTAHEGYRRAGFILQKGENTLPPVPASVLKALEADPRLAVMVIAPDVDSDTSGRLGDQVVSTTVAAEVAPPVTDAEPPVEAPAPDTETAQPKKTKKGQGKK